MIVPLSGDADASVTVSIEVHGNAIASGVQLRAVPEPPQAEGPEAVTQNLVGKALGAQLDLAGAAVWRLEASAAGYWSSPVDVSVPDQGHVHLTLWPAARIRADLRPPRGESAPSRIGLRLLEASHPDSSRDSKVPQVQPASAEVVCPANVQGACDCEVPAGRWDVRAKAEGFAPAYFWNLELRPRQAVALGALALRRGASVMGRVVTDSGPVDREQVAVQLRPLVSSGAIDQFEGRLGQLVLSASVSAWGDYHFGAVPPGSYTLEAQQPGFEPARLSPLTTVKATHSRSETPSSCCQPGVSTSSSIQRAIRG
jgi:hypothetical protein